MPEGAERRMLIKHTKTAGIIIILAAAALLLFVPAVIQAKYINSGSDAAGELVPGKYQQLTVNRQDGYDTAGLYTLRELSVSSADRIYPLYIRVMLNVTWQNDRGQVYGQQPIAGRDYTLIFNDEDWSCEIKDGKYYCLTVIRPGVTAGKLFGGKESQKLTQLRAAPAEGYRLNVSILAQAVQAVGRTERNITAADDAWGTVP